MITFQPNSDSPIINKSTLSPFLNGKSVYYMYHRDVDNDAHSITIPVAKGDVVSLSNDSSLSNFYKGFFVPYKGAKL